MNKSFIKSALLSATLIAPPVSVSANTIYPDRPEADEQSLEIEEANPDCLDKINLWIELNIIREHYQSLATEDQ